MGSRTLMFCRRHPRKRVIQYAEPSEMTTKALQYWVARSSRAMTVGGYNVFR